MTPDRRAVLTDLIRFVRPIADVRRDLAGFPFDAPELVTLRPADAADVLRRFVAGGLDGSHLELWADAIEGRDDIELEASARDQLADLIFELATPEIEGRPDADRAREWLRRLDAISP